MTATYEYTTTKVGEASPPGKGWEKYGGQRWDQDRDEIVQLWRRPVLAGKGRE